MSIRFDLFDGASASDVESSLGTVAASGAHALIVTNDPFFTLHRTRLIQFAARARLPTMYFFATFAEDGGLMAYGASQHEVYRRAAAYVDRILKGAKPGDLPIEQPTRLELVINMKTARALGLKIPPSLLVRADRVID